MYASTHARVASEKSWMSALRQCVSSRGRHDRSRKWMHPMAQTTVFSAFSQSYLRPHCEYYYYYYYYY